MPPCKQNSFLLYVIPARNLNCILVLLFADVSNQMLNLYEQSKPGNSSIMSDPVSSACANNQVKLVSAFEVLPQPKRYSKSVSEKAFIMETIKRVVAAEITEARSSLEEVEDIVGSRPKKLRTEGGIIFKS